MDFNLIPEQEMLKESAHGFLSKVCPKRFVREMSRDQEGFNRELWRKIAELGWLGIHLPENYGGYGGTFLNLIILLEEMGRFCLPSPFFATAVSSKYALLEACNEQQKIKLLPELANGQKIFTLAINEKENFWKAEGVETKAEKDANGYCLNGIKLFVPNANIADYLIVIAQDKINKTKKNLSLFLVDAKNAGITMTPIQTISGEKESKIVFKNVKTSGDSILGKRGRGWNYIEKTKVLATAAKCAEMVGGAEGVLELTLPYARQRIQFGQPIGSFQAIQHYCADMLVEIKGARFITYMAAWKLENGIAADQEVSMAKVWVSKAFKKACWLSHKIHGAIGFTEEHDLHLFTKRAIMGELTLGSSCFHNEIIAKVLGL
jgi:3-oxocholest-4-en-26-oyl-CoA dehydrogenase beta subunit